MLIRALIIACLGLLVMLIASCHQNEDAAIAQNQQAFRDFKQSQFITRQSNSSLLTGTILKILPGRELYGQKTMLIVVDKGSSDGLKRGDYGYFRVYLDADADSDILYEFRAVAVDVTTVTMEGWNPYDLLHVQDRIVLGRGPEASREALFKFFDQEGIQSPKLKT